MLPPAKKENDEIFDKTMAINYYGHCLLIIKLLPLLQQQQSRIIIVSSIMHHLCTIRLHDLQLKELYSPIYAYCQSKLALIMFTYRFNEWIEKNRTNSSNSIYLTINSLHPGICRSDMIEKFCKIIPKFILNSVTRVC